MALGGDEVMFSYNKRLQYPVDIKKKDLRMAKYLVTQYGGRYWKRDIEETRSWFNVTLYKSKAKNE